MNTPRPLRVLHVLHRMDYGGIESWLMGILRLVDRTQVQFDFLVHGSPGAHETEIERLGGRLIRGADPHRLWSYQRRLLEVVRENGPYDVVHSHLHLYSGWVLRTAAAAGVPIRIAHSHNVTPPERGIKRRLYTWAMKRWLRTYATVGLAASEPAIANLYGTRPDSRWQVLLYGLDTTPFRAATDRQALRRSLGIPVDAFVVGNVGRLVAQKNHDLILRIAASIPEAWLLLIGDGELRTTLEAQTRVLGISARTIFAGGRNDVAAVLATMDVFVFPSHFEGLGLAVVEAQAAGLPVVVADTTPSEALVINAACTVIRLIAPIEEWTRAVRTARRQPEIDVLSLIAASPFDRAKSFDRLMAIYRGAA
jgi:glycosyltransferase involved in cell wall biosynthesis